MSGERKSHRTEAGGGVPRGWPQRVGAHEKSDRTGSVLIRQSTPILAPLFAQFLRPVIHAAMYLDINSHTFYPLSLDGRGSG